MVPAGDTGPRMRAGIQPQVAAAAYFVHRSYRPVLLHSHILCQNADMVVCNTHVPIALHTYRHISVYYLHAYKRQCTVGREPVGQCAAGPVPVYDMYKAVLGYIKLFYQQQYRYVSARR